jgi:hypothetical protein
MQVLQTVCGIRKTYVAIFPCAEIMIDISSCPVTTTCNSGILLHRRIIDTSESGTPRRNLFLFAKICGDKYTRNVVFLTTMWDKVHSMEEVEKREMTAAGTSCCHRWSLLCERALRSYITLENCRCDDSATRTALLRREEVADLGKRLKETTGQHFFRALEEFPSIKSRCSSGLREDGCGRTDAGVEADGGLARGARILCLKISLVMKALLSSEKPFGKKGKAVSIVQSLFYSKI